MMGVVVGLVMRVVMGLHWWHHNRRRNVNGRLGLHVNRRRRNIGWLMVVLIVVTVVAELQEKVSIYLFKPSIHKALCINLLKMGGNRNL